MGFSAEGLPIGVQVIGRPNEDELVLAVAEALEEARGKWEAALQNSESARVDKGLNPEKLRRLFRLSG